MIRKSVGTLIALLAISPAFADVAAVCKLADDKRTVTVAFTNPSSQTMACETNCDMAVPNGFGTVSCSKQVPGGAKDLVLCTETKKSGVEYSRVKGVETNCRDPQASAPVVPDKDDKDDDEDNDALIQRLQKQGQDFLDQQKKK
jgi:hypothetical protein